MASVTFFLKEPNSKNETLIYMFLHYSNKKPFKFSTGEKVDPANWNPNKYRLKERRGTTFMKETNDYLDLLEGNIINIYKVLKSEGKAITSQVLKHELLLSLGRIEKKQPITLIQYLESRKKDLEEIKDMKSRDYGAVLAKLELFRIKKNNKQPVRFEDINHEFMERFVSLLESQKLKENTISKYFSIIKTATVNALDRGLHENHAARSRKLRVPVSHIKKHALTDAEMKAVEDVDLSALPKSFDHIRDGFLVRAYTVLRFGDSKKLKPEHFRDGFVYKTTQKTTEFTAVPIHPKVAEILEKHGGLPKTYSSTYTNDGIKKIFELAGIDTEIVVSEIIGGKQVERVVKKYELGNTHTARRSGMTAMKRAGLDDSVIKSFSTHESDASYRKYIDIEQEETAKKAAEHPFFKKPQS